MLVALRSKDIYFLKEAIAIILIKSRSKVNLDIIKLGISESFEKSKKIDKYEFNCCLVESNNLVACKNLVASNDLIEVKNFFKVKNNIKAYNQIT